MLKITDLKTEIDDTQILKGFNIEINPGEVHAIMGPNGSGKSTLAKTIIGDRNYKTTKGEIIFDGQNILNLAPEEIAALGVFLSFQYPVEIPGVGNVYFMRTAYNAIRATKGEKAVDAMDFLNVIKEKMTMMEMDQSFMKRAMNEGFSGGEKKRNEILQMALLEPKLAILDETDSGLDIDSLRIVSQGVNKLRSHDRSILIITHYQRLLEYIEPDYVHVMIDGKIVKSGDKSLALELEKSGYTNLI